MKRTPLKRGSSVLKRTPLKRGESTLKRTPLKAGTSSLKRTPLDNSRSKPMAAHSATSKKGRDSKGRADFVVEVIKRAGGKCQARNMIRYVDMAAARNCDDTAVDVHEPLSRGRGGSTTDFDNAVPLCRKCHDWIHGHPLLATEVGLLRASDH